MVKNPVDAIVVLGAAVGKGGLPSPALRRRLSHAVRLFREGRADYLILTGGVGEYPPSEAAVMRRLALQQGVPEAHLILEETATDTLRNAEACTRIIQQNGWSRVLVVTDGYHLFRSLLVFRACGVEAVGSAPKAPYTGRWCYLCLREVVAVPWYLLRLWRRSL